MDFTTFTALPPEVISTMVHSGPGPESLLMAASAWNSLAVELQTATVSYGAVVTELITAPWTGTSAAAMAGAVTPFVAWLSTAAEQARLTGTGAQGAAAAYETALAATVPPAVVFDNRVRLAALLAGNVFGRNTAAIAALETDYARMWAQDVVAMRQYAASTAAATRLSPVARPPQVTAGGGSGSAVTAAAIAESSGGNAASLGGIPQLLDQLGGAEAALSDPGLSLTATYEDAFRSVGALIPLQRIGDATMAGPNLGMAQFKNFFKPATLLPNFPKSDLGAGLANGAGPGGPASTPPVTIPAATPASTATTVVAEAGRAPSVGALSVPQNWAAATPAVQLATALHNAVPASGLPDAAPRLPDPISPAALGSLTGGALGATPGMRVLNSNAARIGVTGKRDEPVRLDRVVAALQEQPDAVQHWHTTEDELDELLTDLANKPGFHAVHLSRSQSGPKRSRLLSQPR